MERTATLPGVDEEVNSELTELAKDYVEQRDLRTSCLKTEVELKQRVIAKMVELNLKTYHDDEANLSIVLESVTKVKVKIGDDNDDGDEASPSVTNLFDCDLLTIQEFSAYEMERVYEICDSVRYHKLFAVAVMARDA